MKTSNKILTAVAVAIVLIGLGFLIGMRVVMQKVATSIEEGTPVTSFSRGDYIEKEYEQRDFSQLDFSGGWKVRVEAGEEYSVTIRVPQQLEDNLEVKKRGEVLRIGVRGLPDMEASHFEADIVMPELTLLKASGGFDARINGFNGSKIVFEGDGGLNINAKSSRYEDLWVEASGGVNINLRDMPVTNAHIDANGALRMVLTMEGGELTGRINGAASLEYYGDVSKNTLSVSGVSNISHKE